MKNKILSMLIVFILTLSCIGTNFEGMLIAEASTIASGKCGTSSTWTLDSTGLLTISGTGALSYNTGYKPYLSKVTSLVIEEGITSICDSAFEKFTNIKGDLVIPDTVTSIGDSAFYMCENIDGTLTLSSNLKTVKDYAFDYCSDLTGDLYIPDSVTSIGKYAFSKCGFDGNLHISANLTSWGYSAFSGCESLSGELVIPSKVTTIPSGTFYECFKLSGHLTIPDNIVTIERDAFAYCRGFTGLTLSANMTEVPTWCFMQCTGFKGDLIIPEGVNIIGHSAFYGCYGFNGDLVIPDSVYQINYAAFYGCTGFKNPIVLSPNVDFIDERAFYNCRMSSITVTNPDCYFYPESYTIGSSKLIGYSGSTTQTYAKRYGKSFTAFSCEHVWDTDYTLIEYPTDTAAGVKAICCSICGEIQESSEIAYETEPVIASGTAGYGTKWSLGEEGTLKITGSGSMSSVYTSTYKKYANKIKRLIIGSGVSYICENAFSGLTALRGNLVIPDSVTLISDRAFYWCQGLDGTLTLSNNLKTINTLAFSYCSRLKGDLVIPDSVTSIGTYAFCDCGFDGTLTLSENLTQTGYSVFSDCKYLTGELVIPPKLTTLEQSVFYGCESFTGTLVIPETVKEIKRDAFTYCTGFTGLSLPSTVTEIPTWCFFGCTGLKGELVIPKGVNIIGHSAFLGCTGLSSVRIPDTVSEIQYAAFKNCTGMRGELILPDSVVSIEEDAFKSCYINKLTVLNPDCDIYSSSGTIRSGITLSGYTDSTIHKYAKAYGRTFVAFTCAHVWNDFYTIVKAPTATTSGIQAICCSICGEVKEGSEVPYDTELIVASGSCGPNATWSLGEAGTLTISGTGAISDNSGYSQYKSQIKALVINEGITEIGDNAFKGFSALTGALEFPDSLISIGAWAFFDCVGLKGTLTLPDKLQSIGDCAFGYCDGLYGDLIIPDSVTSVGEFAFGYCSGFKGKLKLSENLTMIDVEAFSNCSGFTGDLIIPEGVTYIGNFAFYKCSGFNGKLEIPDSVTLIERDTFSYCSGFRGELVLPNGLTEIPTWAFLGCSGFSGTLVIPESVSTISYSAFNECSGITEVVIPEGVTVIKDNAFDDCYGIKRVFYNGTKADWDAINIGTYNTYLTNAVKFYGEDSYLFQVSYLVDGVILYEEDVLYGHAAVADYVPKKKSDNNYSYSFTSWDKSLNKVTSDMQVNAVFEARAHEFGDWEVTYEPSCMGDGLESRECAHCGYVQDNVILATGHSYVGEVTEPTCISQGYTTYICKGCGDSYESDYTDFADHTYGEWILVTEAGCETDGKEMRDCIYCDAYMTRVVKATGHSYEAEVTEPTCAAEGYTTYTCEACGDEYVSDYIDKLEHNLGEWIVVTEVGCETAGEERRDCADCDYYETRVVEKTGHSYKIKVTEPTCTEQGYTTYTCEVCGDSYVSDYEDALGHSYKTEVTEPTCTSQGFKTYTCENCGDEYVSDYIEKLAHELGEWEVVTEAGCETDGKERRDCAECDYYETRVIDKTGHSYKTEVTEPTCTSQGYTTYTCETCGDSYVSDYTEKLAHDLGEWKVITEAGCETEGEERRDCENCDYYETQIIEATGHSYRAEVTEPTCTEQGYTTYICEVCGDSYVSDYEEAKGHSYKTKITAPTCMSQGYTTYTCGNCGDSYVSDYTDKLAHNLGEWTVVTEAGCETEGEERRDCADCDYYETQVIEATGHSYKAEVTIPTCTTQGFTTYTCENCGDSYLSDYTDKLSHSLGEWNVVTEAGCDTDGEERRDCADCDYYETQAIEAIGHNYKAEVTESTCTSQGYTTYTCENCGDEYVSDYTDKLAHSLGEWTVVTEAGCETDGEERRDCADCDYYETRVVEKTGHSYKIKVIEPTCTEQGYTTYTCEVCGDSYVSDYEDALGHSYKTEVTEPTCTSQGFTTYTCENCGDEYVSDYIEKLAHELGEWEVVIKAGCETDGEERRDCANCGYYEIRVIENTGHTLGEWTVVTEAGCETDGEERRDCADCDYYETRVIEKTGHSLGDWTVATEAGCETDGEEHRECVNCDYFETRVIEQLGHNYKVVVTAPTCTEQGYTTYTCENCGDEYVSDYTEKLAHDLGEWKVVTEADCETDGEERRDCADCDYYETRVIDKNGHSYKTEVTKPTCTEQGYTTYICVNCGDKYVADYTEKTAHNLSEWTVVTEAGCETDGEERRDCADCDYYETRVIEKTGHSFDSNTDSSCNNCGYVKYLLGDVNRDGLINAQDALLVLKHAAKIIVLEENQLLAADVTKDEQINATDALNILKYAAHIIDSF